MEELNDHGALVERWLEQAMKSVPPGGRSACLEVALGALWRRARRTLGEVTLGAVTSRVLFFAATKYPFLPKAAVGADGVRFEAAEKAFAAVEEETAVEAFRFVLVEFLSVLGNLTDEVITPSLHSELSTLKVRSSKRPARSPRRKGGKQ